jgi:hypothetical protein
MADIWRNDTPDIRHPKAQGAGQVSGPQRDGDRSQRRSNKKELLKQLFLMKWARVVSNHRPLAYEVRLTCFWPFASFGKRPHLQVKSRSSVGRPDADFAVCFHLMLPQCFHDWR